MKRYAITTLRTESGLVLAHAKQEPVALTQYGFPNLVLLDYDTYMVMNKKLEGLDVTQGDQTTGKREADPGPQADRKGGA